MSKAKAVASPTFWDDPFRRKRNGSQQGRIAAASIKQGRALTVVAAASLAAAADIDDAGYEVEEAEAVVTVSKEKKGKKEKGEGKSEAKKRSREGGDTTMKKDGNKKQKKDKKQKKHRHTGADDDEREDRLPLDPTCQVRDPLTKEKVLAVVAKSRYYSIIITLLLSHQHQAPFHHSTLTPAPHYHHSALTLASHYH